MQPKPIDEILAIVKVPLNHPHFFSRLFALFAKRGHKGIDPLELAMVDEYDELSRRLDRSRIQESCSVRNVLRTRQLAMLLIDEKGDIQTKALPKLIEYARAHLYSLGPSRQFEAKRQQHILKALELLASNKDVVRLLKKISRPLSNKIAEEVIKNTLQLPPHTVLSDAHARQAVLAAWLCYLRQNVGSCFATAPAIVVHDEQPELFLQDISDLLATGRLKRTFGGIEYSVPISASWGGGDLKKPLFLEISTEGIEPEIWFSQGLIAAFVGGGILNNELDEKAKIKQVKEWVEPIIHKNASRSHYCLVTAEQLIRQIFLQVLGLTEEQIHDYENRPRGLVQGSLIVQLAPSKKGLGGIGERCAHFLYQLEAAYNAFKALADNALLKTWEFTLASFSETKYELSKWNFYASLGLQTNEPGGIGECIYKIIQGKIDELNREIQEMQYKYEMLYTQVKTIESQIKHASSEKDIQWLKIEYQTFSGQLYSLQEQRNDMQSRANALVNLYDALYKLYLDLFKDYFQEVYDADMHEVSVGPFDDSPAGFRLIYKHGRSNTSQWTRIKNQHDFIEALASFFVATEPQIASVLEKQGVEKDLSQVVTAIINHVKTHEFLETALQRMAAAHRVPLVQDPLNHLDQVEKKPWVYTSGGTMNTLVSTYYKIPDKPSEAEKWVESEVELLVFLADTLKHIPYKLMEPFLAGKRCSMLMQSPTHAFTLKPTLQPFKDSWGTQDFTYTSVRDRFVKPAEHFVETLLFNDDMIRYILQLLLEKVPENFKPQFRAVFGNVTGPLNSMIFRDFIVETMEQDRGLNIGGRPVVNEEEIDTLLYSLVPLFPVHELRDMLEKLFKQMNLKADALLALYDQIDFDRNQLVMGAAQFQEIALSLIGLQNQSTTSSKDLHLEVSMAAQKIGYAMPRPVIFADTNWVKDDFGFVVSPGTGKLELWRIDYIGLHGTPMISWKQWLNGSRPDLKWGIYVKPYEYGQ